MSDIKCSVDVDKLAMAFWADQSRRGKLPVTLTMASVGAIGASAFYATPTLAQVGGGGSGTAMTAAVKSIQDGVKNAIEMINAVDGIALAAFGAALAPLGFMLLLRVINMVLSRV